MKFCSGQVKYLVAIRELSAVDDDVKCVDIARHLGVSRSSVSKTLRCLANSGLVYEDFCNGVVLTGEGIEAVSEIFRTFSDVYLFFRKFLKLSHEEAHEQALTFVTTFPDDTCDRLKKLVRRSAGKKS